MFFRSHISLYYNYTIINSYCQLFKKNKPPKRVKKGRRNSFRDLLEIESLFFVPSKGVALRRARLEDYALFVELVNNDYRRNEKSYYNERYYEH